MDYKLENFYSDHFDKKTIEYLNSQEKELQNLFMQGYLKVREYFPKCDVYTTHNKKGNYRQFRIGKKSDNKNGKRRTLLKQCIVSLEN